jgi:hypothetical protein
MGCISHNEKRRWGKAAAGEEAEASAAAHRRSKKQFNHNWSKMRMQQLLKWWKEKDSFHFFLFLQILLFLPQFCLAEFSPDFRAFIHNKYGLPVVNQLERGDLGADASRGGRMPGHQPSPEEPVIIVHGITNKITRFNVRNF